MLFSILKLEILRVGKGEGEAKPKKGVVKEEESGQMEKPKSIPFVTLLLGH